MYFGTKLFSSTVPRGCQSAQIFRRHATNSSCLSKIHKQKLTYYLRGQKRFKLILKVKVKLLHLRSTVNSTFALHRLEHRHFCSTIVQDLKMADERNDTKSPPVMPVKKEKKAFKATDAKILDQQPIAAGKWVSLNLITYQDPLGNKRTWEGVERTTKSKDGQSDAVVIIATLKRMLKYDCIILVKQFRPPLGCCTLEFPAGLVDPGESMESTAVRELKEETGYIGEVKHTSPVTTLDPGTGNCTASIVTVEIDGDIKANRRPVQEAEEEEFIEVLKVPINKLVNFLNAQSKEGIIVDARVYSYAIALAQASKPRLQEIPDLALFDG